MMNKKDIFKKVGGIITELNEQYEYLSQSPENLNELEMELFSANVNFLSDHIAVLVKLNENSKKTIKTDPETAIKPAVSVNLVQVPTEDQEPAEKQEEEVNIPNWKFELDKDSPGSFEFEEKSTDKLFDRPLTDEEARFIDEKTRLKSDKERISEPAKTLPLEEIKPESASDSPPLTINDMLSGRSSQSTVSSQFSQRQIKDLKSMISLNDKLLFVRDLFNGYSLAYSEAIELLNRFDRVEAAENFLKQNYAFKNKWEDKQAVADKFYEILSDRFK